MADISIDLTIKERQLVEAAIVAAGLKYNPEQLNEIVKYKLLGWSKRVLAEASRQAKEMTLGNE